MTLDIPLAAAAISMDGSGRVRAGESSMRAVVTAVATGSGRSARSSLEILDVPDDELHTTSSVITVSSEGWYLEDETAYQHLAKKKISRTASPEEARKLDQLREARAAWLAPRSIVDVMREKQERELMRDVARVLSKYYRWAEVHHPRNGKGHQEQAKKEVR